MTKFYTKALIALSLLFQVGALTSTPSQAATPAAAKGAGSIAGRVTEDSGKPVAGATAETFTCSDDAASGSAVTNKDGEYVITGLSDGCYRVRFSGNSYESSWHGEPQMRESAAQVKVHGEKVTGIDAGLSEAGAIISGNVRGSDGKPLAGAWITAYGSSTAADGQIDISDARSDDKGNFSVQVAPGQYFLIFGKMGYVTQVHGKSLQEPTPVQATEEKPAAGITAALAKGGRVTGSLKDESGKPIEGANVLADPISTLSVRNGAVTDAEGKFVLDGLPSGKYRIVFADLEHKRFPLQWYDRKTTPDDAAVVTVTAPGVTAGISAVVRQGGGLSGRVTDQSGNAIAQVSVMAEPLQGFAIGTNAMTDETGAFSITGLPSGSYRVSFRAVAGPFLPRYYRDAMSAEQGQAVEVTAGQVVTGIDQALPEGTLINGKVTDSSGSAVLGSFLYAYPAGNDGNAAVAFAATGPDGSYSVPVPEGEYVIEASAPQSGFLTQWSGNRATRGEAAPVKISKEAGAKTVDIVLERGASISGTVKNRAGAGIAGVVVTASDAATGGKGRSAVTQEGGRYSIPALASGSYWLRVKGSSAGYIESTLAQEVKLTAPAAVDNIDVVLAQGGSISGKVTDPQGNPVVAAEVTAHDPETWDEVGSTYTGAAGEYTIAGLPANRYHLRFEKADSTYAVQWYRGKVRREDAAPVEVAGTAAVAGIDATLSSGVPLTGAVTDAKGVPLANAKVEVYGGNEDEPFAEVHTEPNGRYRVAALAPGSYRIRFSDRDHIPRWYGGSDRRTAATVTVKDVEVGPVNAALNNAAGKFSGKLMNPEGQKRGQAWLTAIDAATGAAVADERICECSGEFHTPVPAGTYQLRVERHGQVIWFGGATRADAIPLPADGELSGLDMVIEDKIVRVKQIPTKTP